MVVVGMDRRLAFHLVKAKQIACVHYKQDYSCSHSFEASLANDYINRTAHYIA